MGRKLKYRDVVKKQGPKKYSKKKQHPNKNNKTSQFKKRKSEFSEPKAFKKSKPEEFIPPPARPATLLPSSESESEEDKPIDYMQLLRESFGDKYKNIQKNSAVTSSDSSDSDEEEASSSHSVVSNDTDISEGDASNDGAESDAEEDLEDPFIKHFSYELHPTWVDNLQSTEPGNVDTQWHTWPHLGDLKIQIPKYPVTETKKITLLETVTYANPRPIPKKPDPMKSLSELGIKTQIAPHIKQANKSVPKDSPACLTPLQQELFAVMNNYQDLYFPERSFDNSEEIRFTYCLHSLNHVLKTRIKILHHNSKLAKMKDVPEEFRDQGLVRPKVLIVTPFKDAAYKIVNTLISIMFVEDKGTVVKKNRFVKEYTGNELHMPKKNPKPEDYEKTFAGNTDDDFRLGISVTKKTLKLYSDFYSSDILIASPLGLRTIIGAPGQPDRDFDFLASIEILVLDQADVFYMQNWFHVLHLFDHLHLRPKELHGTDISRIRQWSLDLCAKYYRQTLIFSAAMFPLLEALFSSECSNYAGKVKVVNAVEVGTIGQVYVHFRHAFMKFSAATPMDMPAKRFDFFVQKVLPICRDSCMKQTAIYVPCYYDYVRLRNYFKKEDLSFVQICEYSKDSKVARARDMFYHGDAHFLLYTERFHFYHRIKLKGIRHLVFYQPPTYPHFYSEMCNLMTEYNMNKKVGSMHNMSVTVIYTKFDKLQVVPILGIEKTDKIMESDSDVHVVLT